MSEKTQYIIELNDKLSPALKKSIATALKLDNTMNGIGGKSSKGAKGISMLGGALTRLAGPLALAAAGMKAFNVASDSVNTAREFESLTNAINFASGSTEEGAKNMDFLRERADLLGSDLLASTEGFKTLSAAMIGSKLQGQATRDIFDGVQVAATAMGLSSEDAKGTFLALGQIMGKGKVQAEELRGQIGERIPGAFNIAARAMGVSTAKLNKMMEQGELIAEDFLPKFSNELKKTFGSALPNAAESSQAQFNRFNNTLLELKISLGNKLLPIINKVMSLFKRGISILNANRDALKQAFEPAITFITEMKDRYAALFTEFGGGISKMEAFKAVLNGIRFVLKPIFGALGFFYDIMFSIYGVILKIIRGFGTLFTKLATMFPTTASYLAGFLEAFKESFRIIRDTIVRTFGGLGDAIEGALSMDKSLLKKGLKSMIGTEGEDAGTRLKDAFKRGMKEGFGPAIDVNAGPGSKDDNFDDVLKQSKLTQAGGISGGSADSKKSSTSIDGVKSGRPTNIYININKMIETFNVTSTNLEDMNNKAKDLVAQALMSAVNNANLIAQ